MQYYWALEIPEDINHSIIHVKIMSISILYSQPIQYTQIDFRQFYLFFICFRYVFFISLLNALLLSRAVISSINFLRCLHERALHVHVCIHTLFCLLRRRKIIIKTFLVISATSMYSIDTLMGILCILYLNVSDFLEKQEEENTLILFSSKHSSFSNSSGMKKTACPK